jgi:hypothetical protein
VSHRLSEVALVLVVTGAATCATPAVAAAAEGEGEGQEASPSADLPTPSGLRVALRSGVALPLGDAFSASGAMSDTITGSIPVRLDVGYRFARHFYVGAVGQLAAIVPNSCVSDARCSGSDMRLGAMIAAHLLPTRLVDPWLGVGIGYESLSVSRSVGGSSVDISARGLEIFDVELGVDLRPTRSLRLGPVISSSIGSYTRVAVNGTPTSDFATSTHAWVMLGFRGAYDL